MKNCFTSIPYLYGFGSYTPKTVVSNNDISVKVDTSDEWIVSRTGIKTRHYAADGEINADMGFAASQRALERCGISPDKITHLLYGSCTPDSTTPPTACLCAEKLGLGDVMALDINAVCTSFLYGLEVARSIAIATPSSAVLLVGSDMLSRRQNWNDRTTCILFGDAAGAGIITCDTSMVTPGSLGGSIIDVHYSSDGSLGDLLVIKGGFSSHPYALGDIVGPEYFVTMQGREVFRYAVRNMYASCKALLERNALSIDDIDLLIPHQANIRIIEGVGSRLKIAPEKVFINLDKYGNTSAASVPLALSEAVDAGLVSSGKKVLLTAFGGGFTWSSVLLQF